VAGKYHLADEIFVVHRSAFGASRHAVLRRRLALALFATHGIELPRWPSPVRNALAL